MNSADGAVESFDVADLQQQTPLLRQLQQLVGLGQRCRHRLFHEDRPAGSQRRQTDLGMRGGGDRNGHRLGEFE